MCNRWPFLVLNTVLFLVWIHFHKWARDASILLTCVFTHPILCIGVCVCQVSCCSCSLFECTEEWIHKWRPMLCPPVRFVCSLQIQKTGINSQDCDYFGGLIVNRQRLKWNPSILHHISCHLIFFTDHAEANKGAVFFFLFFFFSPRCRAGQHCSYLWRNV